MGKRFQKLRQAAGLSQSQLARAANVPVASLRQWEQGRRTPLLDAAARVAEALDVSLDDLAGIGTPPRRKKAEAAGDRPPPAPAKRRGKQR
jgi:transcriptional regulator with XRE-family HTH domain